MRSSTLWRYHLLISLTFLIMVAHSSSAAAGISGCSCSVTKNTVESNTLYQLSAWRESRVSRPVVKPKLQFQIHLFSPLSRNDEFDSLFRSINQANKISSHVSLNIHVDSYSSKQDAKKSLKFLKSLSCKHGDIQLSINANRINSTSRQHIRDATNLWIPASNDEFVIFLANVKSVSKHFLEFSEQVVNHYFLESTDPVDNILGISLLSHLAHNPVHNTNWYYKSSTPYFLQHPHENGMIFTPRAWIQFVEWKMLQNPWIDPFIPDSKTNAWPSDSWIKSLLRFMAENGKTIFYPNLPQGFSLAKPSERLKQKHIPSSPLLDLHHGTSKLLLGGKEGREFTFRHLFPPISTIKSFNSHFQELSNITQLKTKVDLFDGCTMIMQVYSRAEFILNRIQFYHNMPLLSSIIVVWNNMNTDPPKINHPLIPSSARDPQNPTFIIPTSCVIAMDDDWDFSHVKLLRAIRVWQRTGFNQLVGFYQQGRVHVKRNDGRKTLRDLKVSGVKPESILVDEKVDIKWGYGKNTKNALPQRARDVVEELTNCDDILFNMMIANATRLPPVVLEDGLKIEKSLSFEGDGKGLWKDNEHWAKRAWCMNYFVDNIFDGLMPLKASRVGRHAPNRMNGKNTKNGEHLMQAHDIPCKVPYMYTYELPQRARDVVEELTNCDDILFNMMIANATRLPQ
ncbi:nucleotide-diphospho-sugar transferase [Rhizoclosmatium globosum]|uniref:Nucleotide-diphospho-sugar transferase n=1 Tax=Rhizoclosmatium globosum TaxID=329046 RepID=A0A1Y2CQL7_9FUNG|nr:nucleotide-diphospho-sugar transferase [Rhizoclosmatium globosum]|eukprot:ORY49329.1 nucleotide-diphospho-sugar transferase [Rhizoclosmatium globosum]